MTDTKMSFKEALIAHLQGEKVECNDGESWVEIFPAFDNVSCGRITESGVGWKFRIKPRTVMCNGVEVPAPESVAPESMTKVFAPSTFSIGLYSSWCWHSDRVDDVYLERGLIYLNKEDAIARAKAMLITK